MSKPGVLFLCTGNSARSQMAEALLRHEAGDRFEVYSAGTEPKGVHPLTLRALAELGIDASGQRSKHVQELLGRVPLAYLIAVCGAAEQSCPVVPLEGSQRLFWPFDDPAAAAGSEEERLHVFRVVRDQIHAKIKAWLQ